VDLDQILAFFIVFSNFIFTGSEY
ncbi:uncharacterized protein METZ01_LOCUS311691, partial [marine metagenome]